MYLENLIELRKAKGISIKRFASELGVSRQLIYDWQKSGVIPNNYAPKVCDLLGVKFEDQEFNDPQFLLDFRLRIGLSGSEMSALLDVEPSTVSRWENGDMEISRNATIRLHSLYKAYTSDLKSPDKNKE